MPAVVANGDRWTLLIVRELPIRGPSRYTDLKRGLPGIATNGEPDALPATLELRTGAEPLAVTVAGGEVTVRAGAAAEPDAVMEGPPERILAVLLGGADAATVAYAGNARLLARITPRPPAACRTPARTARPGARRPSGRS